MQRVLSVRRDHEQAQGLTAGRRDVGLVAIVNVVCFDVSEGEQELRVESMCSHDAELEWDVTVFFAYDECR